jgi:Zn finger protein HypA/HybF involved in hydrogenase expression
LRYIVIIEKPNMRELQIVQSIFDQLLRQIHESGERKVNRLQLTLGGLSDFDRTSIQTYWKQLSKGTLAEQAQLHIRLITAGVQSVACFQKYRPMDTKISCPYCGSFGAKILTGEECHRESIET